MWISPGTFFVVFNVQTNNFCIRNRQYSFLHESIPRPILWCKYIFWLKLNFVKFNQVYCKYINFYNTKLILLDTMKYIFILYTFCIMDVDTFCYLVKFYIK
jgi:hypothetical protein